MSLLDFLKKPEPEKPLTDIELAKAICEEIWSETVRPVKRYTLEPGESGIFESKVGGTPYLPREAQWPRDGRGNPMDLLAQVDCAALKDMPDFPHEGILQFFVGRDDVFGIDFKDPITQNGFRVVYHETVDSTVTAEEAQAKRPPAPADDDDYYSPLFQPCRIVFGNAETQGMTQNDYRFDGLFLEKWNQRRPDAPLEQAWDFFQRFPQKERPYNIFTQPDEGNTHHHLGGYPYFTQEDPRAYKKEYRDLDVLLFQLDSDMRDRKDLVLWGDCGIGNFFISPEALKNKDFSRVLYNWDCC